MKARRSLSAHRRAQGIVRRLLNPVVSRFVVPLWVKGMGVKKVGAVGVRRETVGVKRWDEICLAGLLGGP